MQPCREFQIRNQNEGVSEICVHSSIFCDCSFDKLGNFTALHFWWGFYKRIPQSRHQNSMTSPLLRTVVTSFQIFTAFASAPVDSSSMYPLIYNGCFTSSTEMKDLGPYVYQTPNYCQQQCINLNKSLMATSRRSHCWCGDSPSEFSGLGFDAECSSACTGYNIGSCR